MAEDGFAPKTIESGGLVHDELPPQQKSEVAPQPAAVPAKNDEQPKPAPAPDPKRPRFSRRTMIVAGIVGLLGIAGAIWGVLWWMNARHFETTDDAFISARSSSIAPKVTGYVADVPVTDNQLVEAGAQLVRIDDRDYRTALDQARAQVTQAEAGISTAQAQFDAQGAAIDQAAAQVDVATAALDFAKQQQTRSTSLATQGYGSQQTAQQAQSDLGQKQASVVSAKAAVESARRQRDVLKAQMAGAEATLAQAKAGVAQAELNLSNTTVTAQQRGRVVQLSAAKGMYAATGQSLMMFVPSDLWVVANFKETQITDIRVGQPVDVTVDAYPGHKFTGHIESIQAGSGSAFSLLPAENATGNYVKVTQRIPVKIALDPVADDIVLGPGMSVTPEVRVR